MGKKKKEKVDASIRDKWEIDRIHTQNMYTYMCVCVCVTGYKKTQHMGYFVKIWFVIYLISTTIELTFLRVGDQLRASLSGQTTLCAPVLLT